MNIEQAGETIVVLQANWPQLRDLDKVGVELWYRNALRHTPAAGNGSESKPDALEIIDALVSTMTYAPKPADWVRVEAELVTERRRRTTYSTALNEPEMPKDQRLANIARLRDVIASVRANKEEL